MRGVGGRGGALEGGGIGGGWRTWGGGGSVAPLKVSGERGMWDVGWGHGGHGVPRSTRRVNGTNRGAPNPTGCLHYGNKAEIGGFDGDGGGWGGLGAAPLLADTQL